MNAALEDAIAKEKALKEGQARTALLEKNLQEMKRLAQLKVEAAALAQPAVAAKAAAGWGGDFYQVYYNEDRGETVLAAHWAWDTQTDAREFNQAMLDYLDKRFRGNKLDREDGVCWESNGQVTCLFTNGSRTLWLIAPSEDVLIEVASLYESP